MSAVAQGLQSAWHSGQYDPSEWEGQFPLCCPLSREAAVGDDGAPQLDAQGNPIIHLNWKPLPYAILREASKAARDKGIQSPFFLGLVEGIASTHLMLPQDWKDLLRMLLTPSQYSVWDQEYRLAAQARQTGDAIYDQIYGSGQWATIPEQLQLGDNHLLASWQCVQRAIKRTPEKGRIQKSFATVRQGPTEPYTSFIDRLQVALQRQIDNPEASAELLKKLAYENANADCRKALGTIAKAGGAELADYIKACQDVGTKGHEMLLLAQAIQGQKGNCFNCKRPGHFKAECRAPGGGHQGKGGRPNKPSKKCPKCGKGYHWANQCRSGGSSGSGGAGESGN